MHRAVLLVVAAAILSSPARAQQPQEETQKLTFKFKDAAVDAVLQYVSSATGWIFIQEKKITGTLTAVSDAEVPVGKCLDFLNAALRPQGAVIPNPYSPSLPKAGQVLKVVDVDEAKRRNIEIFSGSNPDDIPLTDQIRTQIIPLKAVNVTDVKKELEEVLKKAVEPDGQVAISTYSNSVVLTGRADGIQRVVRILKMVDVSANGELKIRVFLLKNSDAVETAKVLNDVFKKENIPGAQGNAQNPANQLWRMFGQGGGGRQGGDPGAQRAPAHEMVRITGEPRTNSIIVSATEDNVKVIEDLIQKLDDKTSAAIKMKLYPLRYADATSASKLINDLFSTPASSSQRTGNRQGNPNVPVWQGGGPQTSANDPTSSKEVRAVADLRTNSVIVAASEQNLVLIDGVMTELDRQVNDVLEVKIYRLQNADPQQMATILQSLFRPQVNATQNSGRATPQQGQGNTTSGQGVQMFGRGGQQGGNALSPSQEVEITADVRTRSVIVKASKDYIAVMDDVIKDLDADPTESVSTYVLPLRNADASTLAATLQSLLRGTGGGGTRSTTQNQGLFSGMQSLNNQQNQSRNTQQNNSTRGNSQSRTRNLGPLESQDPGPAPAPQDEESRRGVEGQVDVEADPTTNSLVLRTSPRNYQAIQGMLQDLDRMRPQVLIKVLIADVTLDERTQFGVEGFWEGRMRVPGGDLATDRGATDFALATQGFTYTLTSDDLQATLNLFAQEGKLRVLATPRILVLDNQSAMINVGKQVPRVTSSQINQLGNTVNTIVYENVGIILNVVPHINPDGLVTMDVAPEISDVASEAESVQITPGVNSPTFNVNSAQTRVSVRNGTTVVIGGLIRETMDDTVQKVPILGDIPILKYLFSNTTQRKVKRELMIFLTPYVAFTAAELEEITELEKSKLKLIDPRDIQAESDRWLERIRK